MIAEDAIVAALSTVPGLTATPVPPPSILAGMAWPAFNSHGPLRNNCITEQVFYVYVAPPANGDYTAAAQLREDIPHALATAGKVTAGEAWSIAVEPGGQSVPVTRYTLEV
jgi:hypothetical protein